MSTPATKPPRRRVKKRILIPVILLGLALAFLLWLYVRGTWASDTARDPQSSGEGTVTQLYRDAAGNVQVRCAIVIDAAPAEVWSVVRDYPKHPSFLPYLASLEVEEREGNEVQLRGIAHSRLWGDWPFTAHVRHRNVDNVLFVASWDNPSDTLPVNRGGWSVMGLTGGQTLLVNTLEVEAAGYPNFLVRNLIMDRLHRVVAAMRDEVMRRREKG
jgi:ribosome-associated toxin RatA of RatAB toxin-antitoxin module